jgi:hypothetical protein
MPNPARPGEQSNAMVEMKTFRREFGQDNDLNVFGDYTHLVCVLKREAIGPKDVHYPRTEETWLLSGPNTVRVLNPDEVFRALHTYFFRHETELEVVAPSS